MSREIEEKLDDQISEMTKFKCNIYWIASGGKEGCSWFQDPNEEQAYVAFMTKPENEVSPQFSRSHHSQENSFPKSILKTATQVKNVKRVQSQFSEGSSSIGNDSSSIPNPLPLNANSTVEVHGQSHPSDILDIGAELSNSKSCSCAEYYMCVDCFDEKWQKVAARQTQWFREMDGAPFANSAPSCIENVDSNLHEHVEYLEPLSTSVENKYEDIGHYVASCTSINTCMNVTENNSLAHECDDFVSHGTSNFSIDHNKLEKGISSVSTGAIEDKINADFPREIEAREEAIPKPLKGIKLFKAKIRKRKPRLKRTQQRPLHIMPTILGNEEQEGSQLQGLTPSPEKGKKLKQLTIDKYFRPNPLEHSPIVTVSGAALGYVNMIEEHQTVQINSINSEQNANATSNQL